MAPSLLDRLSTLPVMCATAIALAVFWGIVLETSKKKVNDSLPGTGWWHRAAKPVKSMMYNFGYPSNPTKKFPNAVTDEMARDFYAFQVTILFQHFLSALPMVPVLVYGWEDSSEVLKSMFILGTLSDVGFDIYDSWGSTVRTFTKHPDPLPIEFWVILVMLHHTMSLILVLPMNLKYVHRYEYHQTAVSLLMAATLCYGAGCWKFTLDIGNKKRDFMLYKIVALFQLGIILYTRLYLWIPAAISFRDHLKEQNDTAFFYGASIMISIFSLFNFLLVVDGFKAVMKCIPKKFPRTKLEKENTVRLLRRTSSMDAPGIAPIAKLTGMMARRKFKGAVRSVIAANRMRSISSDVSEQENKSD